MQFHVQGKSCATEFHLYNRVSCLEYHIYNAVWTSLFVHRIFWRIRFKIILISTKIAPEWLDNKNFVRVLDIFKEITMISNIWMEVYSIHGFFERFGTVIQWSTCFAINFFFSVSLNRIQLNNVLFRILLYWTALFHIIYYVIPICIIELFIVHVLN